MPKVSYRASFAPEDTEVKEVVTFDLDKLGRLDEVTEVMEIMERSDRLTVETKQRTMAEIMGRLSLAGFDDEDDISLYLSDSDEEQLVRKSEAAPDFFDSLGTLPNVSDISDESDMQSTHLIEQISAEEKERLARRDVGMFVDPLTGELIVLGEEEEEVGEEEAEEEHVPSDITTLSSSMEDEELLALLGEQEKKIEEVPKETAMEEQVQGVLETFLELDIRKVTMFTATDIDDDRRESVLRNVAMATIDFVEDIIDSVVDRCEYVPPRTILRKGLDKSKLMSELRRKLDELHSEEHVRFFVNRKAVEYFRRKGMFRAISDDHPDTISTDMQKYKVAIGRLDALLGKHADMTTCTQKKLSELTAACTKTEADATGAISDFEEMVRKLFYRENHVRFNAYIDELLTRISDLREEISSVRLVLVQRQHTYARQKQNLDNLENIGDGLTMKDFEHLQTETQAISKKIEERNTDLAKARIRFNCDLHIMAHTREKCHLIRDGVEKQNAIFEELNGERKLLRRRVNALKLERLKVYKEMRRLRIQGGLLDNPVLMLDYDATQSRVLAMRDTVLKLKAKHADIQFKIAVLEKTEKKVTKQEVTTEALFEESMLYTNDYYGNMGIYMPL